jgi:hypothetical protein
MLCIYTRQYPVTREQWRSTIEYENMVTKAVRQDTFRIRGFYFIVIGLSWIGLGRGSKEGRYII